MTLFSIELLFAINLVVVEHNSSQICDLVFVIIPTTETEIYSTDERIALVDDGLASS